MDYLLFGLISIAAVANAAAAWYLSQTLTSLRAIQAALAAQRPSAEDVKRMREMQAFVQKLPWGLGRSPAGDA